LSDKDRRQDQEDLEKQEGQPLPDREVMTVITPDPTAEPGFVHHEEPPPDSKMPIDWINDPPERNDSL
jgi:hypothetical protein